MCSNKHLITSNFIQTHFASVRCEYVKCHSLLKSWAGTIIPLQHINFMLINVFICLNTIYRCSINWKKFIGLISASCQNKVLFFIFYSLSFFLRKKEKQRQTCVWRICMIYKYFFAFILYCVYVCLFYTEEFMNFIAFIKTS